MYFGHNDNVMSGYNALLVGARGRASPDSGCGWPRRKVWMAAAQNLSWSLHGYTMFFTCRWPQPRGIAVNFKNVRRNFPPFLPGRNFPPSPPKKSISGPAPPRRVHHKTYLIVTSLYPYPYKLAFSDTKLSGT